MVTNGTPLPVADGRSVLEWAVMAESFKAVEYLLSVDNDADFPSLLALACDAGSWKSALWLMKKVNQDFQTAMLAKYALLLEKWSGRKRAIKAAQTFFFVRNRRKEMLRCINGDAARIVARMVIVSKDDEMWQDEKFEKLDIARKSKCCVM